MRIGFFSPDFVVRGDRPTFGGSAHYRCVVPARELRKHGHETFVSPTLIVHKETGYLTGQGPSWEYQDPDVIVIHSWPEDSVAAILAARRAGQIIVGDMDDLIWEIPQYHQAEGLNTAEKNKGNIWRNLMACSAITVSTPYLKEWIEGSGIRTLIDTPASERPPVFVVRNALDLDAFTVNSMRDKVRVIGWSGNPLWRDDDLSLLRPWLSNFLDVHKLKFLHVGALPHATIADQLGIREDQLLQRAFSTFEDYRPSNPLREMDIQLIPLLDTPFNRAKSALKGLESAAWGVPFVSSPIDSYAEAFPNDLGAVTWRAYLEMMLARQYRRERLMDQELAARSFSIALRWTDWLDVYSDLAAS